MRAFGITLVIVALAATTTTAEAQTLRKFKNCASVHAVYPHGIARKGYTDKGDALTGLPKVSTALYNAQPKTLDRDKDGIACEA